MCPECAERERRARELYLNDRLGAAAKEVLVGAAEMFGLKEKTALEDTKREQETAAAEAPRSHRRLVPSEVHNPGDAG